jgi:hypothetical protein
MFSRKAAVLAVTLTFALPWCATAARPAFSLPARWEASSSLEQLRTGLWSWLRGVWTKEGCTIDPSGRPACRHTSAGDPAPTSPTSNADAGCTIDPGGSPCGGRQ